MVSLTKKHTVLDIPFDTDLVGGVDTKDVEKALSKLHVLEYVKLKAFVEAGYPLAIKPFTLAEMLGGALHFTEDGVRLELRLMPDNTFEEGVIVHELTHFDQWQRGDLTIDNAGQVCWKGVAYQVTNRPSADYLDQPWEKEAHEAQYAFMEDAGQSWFSVENQMRMRRAQLAVIGWTMDTTMSVLRWMDA